jgi:hypothetical protein
MASRGQPLAGTPGAVVIDPSQSAARTVRCRRSIEAIFRTLRGQLALEAHGGCTLAGVYAGVAAPPSRPGCGDLA